MLGRDFGQKLAYRVKNWQKQAQKQGLSFTGMDLRARNAQWLEERAADLEGRNPSALKLAQDESETIEVLTVGCRNRLETPEAVSEVIETLTTAFQDTADQSAIVLSSTHKFKGDERNRVFLLSETYKAGENQEESNLYYVGVTRAKTHLTFVHGLKNNKVEGLDE